MPKAVQNHEQQLITAGASNAEGAYPQMRLALLQVLVNEWKETLKTNGDLSPDSLVAG